MAEAAPAATTGAAADADAAFRAVRPATRDDAEAWVAAGAVLLAAAGLAARVGGTAAQRRAATDLIVAGGVRHARAASGRLVAGRSGVDAWRRSLWADLRPRHGAAAILGVGSREVHPATLAVLALLVTRQARHLARFAAQARARAPGAVGGRLLVRSEMYAHAVYAVGRTVEQADMERRGYREARRILGVADHCSSCLAYANRWLPIATCPPIGSLDCLGRCHCHMVFR